VKHVVVVDDGSPDALHAAVGAVDDRRVHLVVHDRNRGVGAAMKTGFAAALALGADIVVKVDGDGQIDPAAIPALVAALAAGEASLAKGNRLFDLRLLRRMPLVRRVGNLALSFLVKLASGYWRIFDPCNGFVAIRADLLRRIPPEALADRYFFEISLLCEAYLARAVCVDVPMAPAYRGEASSLNPAWSAVEFLPRLVSRALRRVLVTYFLRDFTVVSVFLITGLPLFGFGVVFSGWHWWRSFQVAAPTPTGTIVLGALSIALGFELLLQALVADVQNEPRPGRT
jgi:dolichol-phosphate mannosyltransferase